MGLDQGSSENGEAKQINIKSYSTEEAAMIFDAAEKIIVVPGYGLAVAQAQHAVREVADFLSKKEKSLYAIILLQEGCQAHERTFSRSEYFI